MKKTIEEMMEEDAARMPQKAAPKFDTNETFSDTEADLFQLADDSDLKAKIEEWKKVRTYPILGKLRDHQWRALVEADEKEGHAWFMDPGAGKTLTAIAEAGRLYEMGKVDGAIVMAPNGPHKQWLDEQFPKWAGYRWAGIHNKMPPVTGIKAFMDKRITAMGVLCINYESIATAKGQRLLDQFFEKFPRIYLIADESQKIKGWRSARSKDALKLALRAAYRRVLTGTPILKGLEDLWTQYEFCEAGLAWPLVPISVNHRGTLDRDGFMGYRAHYCKIVPQHKLKNAHPAAIIISGYKHEDHLRERVKGHSTRVMSDEFMVGEKPDFIKVSTPMTDDQAREYRRMEEHLISMFDEEVITAQNALVQLGKLLQIASGFIMDEERDVKNLGGNKVNAAMTLIEQMDEPFIIWTPFIPLRQMIINKLYEEGLAKHVYGKDAVEAWKKDDNGILVGNQSSGLGVGMNLQHAAANIYLANNFSAEARWQSLKRTDRIGQTRQVRNWDLIAPDTVDEGVLQNLAQKQDISRMTIDELRNMIR